MKQNNNKGSEKESPIEIRSRLWKALLGELSIDEMNAEFKKDSSDDVVIHLDPIAIIHVLEKYLQNDLDENYVREWALFVRMILRYVSPNDEYCEHNNDEKAYEKYYPVWEVIEQLTCPAIDGELTPARAKELIHLLYEFMRNTP